MKRLFFILLIIISALGVTAQTKPKSSALPVEKPKTVTRDYDLELYQKAISFGDYDVAKTALYNMIIKNPDSLNYMDSLVTLYFSLGAMPQCILAGNLYLQRDTSNHSVMEMVAISYSQLNKNKEALEIYERMFNQTGNIYYGYQTAVQQFYLKRVGECSQMIDIILKNPKAETEKIAINVDQNTQQQVPIKAATLNMRGIILKEMSQMDKAKESFEEALKIMPDFALAKGNIDAMNKPAKEVESGDGKNGNSGGGTPEKK